MQKDREALNFRVCGLKIHLMIDWHQDRGQFRQFGGEEKKQKNICSLCSSSSNSEVQLRSKTNVWVVGKLFAKLDAS